MFFFSKITIIDKTRSGDGYCNIETVVNRNLTNITIIFLHTYNYIENTLLLIKHTTIGIIRFKILFTLLYFLFYLETCDK